MAADLLRLARLDAFERDAANRKIEPARGNDNPPVSDTGLAMVSPIVSDSDRLSAPQSLAPQIVDALPVLVSARWRAHHAGSLEHSAIDRRAFQCIGVRR